MHIVPEILRVVFMVAVVVAILLQLQGMERHRGPRGIAQLGIFFLLVTVSTGTVQHFSDGFRIQQLFNYLGIVCILIAGWQERKEVKA